MNELYEVEVCVDANLRYFCQITEIATGYPEHVTQPRKTEAEARADADQWRESRKAQLTEAA